MKVPVGGTMIIHAAGDVCQRVHGLVAGAEGVTEDSTAFADGLLVSLLVTDFWIVRKGGATGGRGIDMHDTEKGNVNPVQYNKKK